MHSPSRLRPFLALLALLTLSGQAAPPPPAPPAPPPAAPPAPSVAPAPSLDGGSSGSSSSTDSSGSGSSSSGTSSAKASELADALKLLDSLGLSDAEDEEGGSDSGMDSLESLLADLGKTEAASIAPVLVGTMEGDAVALSWSQIPGVLNYAILRGAPGAKAVSEAAYEDKRTATGTRYEWKGLKSGYEYAFMVIPITAKYKASNIARVKVAYESPLIGSSPIALPSLAKSARLCVSVDPADYSSTWIWSLESSSRGLVAYKKVGAEWKKAAIGFDPVKDGKVIDFASRGSEAIVSSSGTGGKVLVRYLKASVGGSPSASLVYEGLGFAYYLSSAALGSELGGGSLFCFGTDPNGSSPGGAGARILIPKVGLKTYELPISKLARNLGVVRAFAPGGRPCFAYFDLRWDGSTVDAGFFQAKSGTGTAKAPLAFASEERILDGDEDPAGTAKGGDILDAVFLADSGGSPRAFWILARADGMGAVLSSRSSGYKALGAAGSALAASGASRPLPPDPPSGRPFALLSASAKSAGLVAWNGADGRAYCVGMDAVSGEIGLEYALGAGTVDSVEAGSAGFYFTLRAADGTCSLRVIE